MNNRGLTLTELMVVIVIISILVGVAGYTLRGRMMGYRVENQVKGMYADLMNARARAMQQNRIHFIQVTANTYQIIEDTNENSANNAGAGDDTIINRALQYPLLAFPAAITMNTRGLITPDTQIQVDIGNNVVDYDCFVLSTTKINIGQWVGGACVVK
mgnify:CR=1 FL=1